MNAVRGDSRVGCESLMASKQQKSEPPAADQRARAVRKGGLSFGSLSVIGLPKPAFGSPGGIRSNSMRSHSGPAVSIIPREAMGKKKGGAFESEEPASPKVTCIGRVKSRPSGVSSRKQPRGRRSTRPGIDSREVSKCACRATLRLSGLFGRLLSGGRRKGICAPKSPVEEAKICEPNGVGLSESFKMDDPLPKPEFGIGPSETNLWRRRFVAKPKALELFRNGPPAFGTAKTLTS